MDCLPLPVVCIQCGPGVNNPCHFKFIGPTIGFVVAVFLAIICWPLALFFCCCATDAGKKLLAFPADTSAAISDCFPI
ncbi:hypothetical protein F5883DRAFT_148415 [Diaporthe sp. PMI_573]|nr:hypothetical protein F5883DRAFT_148415 [Diaporthaceae sp. PMI_573]